MDICLSVSDVVFHQASWNELVIFFRPPHPHPRPSSIGCREKQVVGHPAIVLNVLWIHNEVNQVET